MKMALLDFVPLSKGDAAHFAAGGPGGTHPGANGEGFSSLHPLPRGDLRVSYIGQGKTLNASVSMPKPAEKIAHEHVFDVFIRQHAAVAVGGPGWNPEGVQ